MAKSETIVTRATDVFTPALHLYYPLAIAAGRGVEVNSVEGKRYLDFSSGLAVLNLGHNHPRVMAAARDQMANLVHTGGIYYNETVVKAAEKLASVTPAGLDMVFFSNSGAEAVEGALKLARYVTGRQGIISFTGAFHGRTLGAVSVTTSSARYRKRYLPLLPSVYQVPYPSCFRCPFKQLQGSCELLCLEYLRDLLERVIFPDEVAAVIVEPVLGEGGYIPAPRNFLRELRILCTQFDIQLIFDEVQSGFGRTGHWFATQHYEVSPDILTVAKGIASGFPLSAVVAGKRLMSRWDPGAHGTTFGGNPVSCAAAVATMTVIEEEGLLEKVRVTGEKVLSRLREIAADSLAVGDVRGLGFMIGIEFVDEQGAPDGSACRKVLDFCLQNGLILIECGPERNVVRFAPPLIASDDDLEQALTIFEEGVRTLR